MRCECLGAAKPVQISDGGHHVPGACVALTNEIGARTNYILVAHGRDGIWLCHPGMFQGDVPDVETLIFHEDGLVRKNIHTEAWDGARPVKRAKPHAKFAQLRKQVEEHNASFGYLVSWAAWCVEEAAAQRWNRAVDLGKVAGYFEQNAFKWYCDGWTSRIHIAFLWQWVCDGKARSKLVRVHANNFMDTRRVPPPIVLSDEWDPHKVKSELEKYLTEQVDNHKCPCVFLGIKTGNKYEPDLWRWEGPNANTKVMVWFQFEHVRFAADDTPYRVGMSLHDIHHKRDLLHPLNKRARFLRRPRFTLEFLHAFADLKQKGARYAGILYDNCPERPEYRLDDVPNNGVDMLDEKVNWTLASGAVECHSLSEFKDAKLDEEKDSEASYKSIGGHFGYEPLGVPEDEEQEAAWHEYRDAPGPVGERRWERAIKWKQPATEVVSCWWATNMTARDQSEEAKFLCRSVATLRVILGDLRALRLSVLPCLS